MICFDIPCDKGSLKYCYVIIFCFLFLIVIKYRILLYIYRNMRHYNPKSGRQAVIQAAKDGHNPRPENTPGHALPLFYAPRQPNLQQALSSQGSHQNSCVYHCQHLVCSVKAQRTWVDNSLGRFSLRAKTHNAGCDELCRCSGDHQTHALSLTRRTNDHPVGTHTLDIGCPYLAEDLPR